MPDTATRHGFTLQWEREVSEIRTIAQFWRHDKTGARVLCLKNDDENKVFGISFRTPPKDSTGVAHILEHSVLCGSRKYPVKEPFVELLKGSLQTFLNAFTFPDKTCYPVASTNETDFYNLVDVYFDAVFHPRIDENVLRQEGWHYELDDAAGPMRYKGVVYNEMKGAYSSPDSVLAEHAQQSLFPGATYGLDSGGNPEKIPDLTFEAFLDFHRSYYHPSNAWIWFYGDGDTDRHLATAAAYLDEYEPLAVDSRVTDPAPFAAPVRRVERYAAPGEDAKAMSVVNVLLGETTDAKLNLALHVLHEILVGMPSSPLRKALMDSGLGEDVTGVGLEADLKQLYFSTGLKGVAPADADKVEPLILGTLEKLATEGIDADMVAAALNTVEFDLRENNSGSFPRGLSLMVRALSTWLYDADPLLLLRYEEPLAWLKGQLAADPRFFEGLIRRHLLDNPHRATVTLLPDAELARAREAAEEERLARAFEAMDQAGREEVARLTRELNRLQEEPDAPEALALIPRLTRADLPRENQTIPTAEGIMADVTLLAHDLPTDNIVYLDLGFDLAPLSDELLPWAPIFGRAILELGTARTDHVTMGRRIAQITGGISAHPGAASRVNDPAPAARLFVRAKAVRDKAPAMAEILAEVLTEADLGNRERFRQMVLEEKARLEQRLAPQGHSMVLTRLGARFGRAGALAETFSGVSQIFFLRKLAGLVEADWPRVASTLEELRRLVLVRGCLVANLTQPSADHAAFEPALRGLLGSLPAGCALPPEHPAPAFPAREGLTFPAQVNYVGKGVSLANAGYEVRGGDMVVARYLRTAYLWEKVRVTGGAYGGMSALDEVAGTFACVSYRDPNLERTVKVYDEIAAYLRDFAAAGAANADEIDKAVVGAIGAMDAYKLPDAKGWTAFMRRLIGRDEAQLDRIRQEILAAGPGDFARFAEAAAGLAEKGDIVVLGRREQLTKSPLGLTLTEVL